MTPAASQWDIERLVPTAPLDNHLAHVPGTMPIPTPPLVARPSLKEIRQAADRLRGAVVRTPLVRLGVDEHPGEIYLKLENLQSIGSFKVRGSGNAVCRRARITNAGSRKFR